MILIFYLKRATDVKLQRLHCMRLKLFRGILS